MKNIKIILIQFFLLFPKFANAISIIKPSNRNSNILDFQSNSPVLIFINIAAFFALNFSIITFMQGYTKYDLASGNVGDLTDGRKTMTTAALVFLFVIIVFIIDLNSYR